ncbi:hypothetical protein Tco_0212400 [Tanacetum coccineum]
MGGLGNTSKLVKTANQAGKMCSYPSECIEEFVSLVHWCCNDNPTMLGVVWELECILEKMPEKRADFSQPESSPFVESSSISSHFSSSNVPGSDLDSGGNPIVYPP